MIKQFFLISFFFFSLNAFGEVPRFLSHDRTGVTRPETVFNFEKEITTTLRNIVLQNAKKALKEKPVTITAYPAKRSAGGIHDFYSEGDYWWPNPISVDSPYIQKDGLTNPDNFVSHREMLTRFSMIIGALASAYKITANKRYARHALQHCKAWFINAETRMNPSLLYAQAIKGRVTGRGIGIIDMIQMMEVAQGLMAIKSSGLITQSEWKAYQGWFSSYLQWVTTHEYGKTEMAAKNNHGTCWVMQVSVFAKLAEDKNLMEFCRKRYKEVLLPTQMAVDGSFPLELNRTKPYGYSLFNLDAMTTICQVLSTPEDDLWAYTLADGKNIKKGVEFLYPFVQNKTKWPYQKDVMYWDEWPVAQPFMIFAASKYQNKNWLQTWIKGNHSPTENEVIRNLPVRNPLLWF